MREPMLSPIGNDVPSLVQVTVRVLLLLMPSCSVDEQNTLRICPANVTLLKGSILTTGVEGTVERKCTQINNN